MSAHLRSPFFSLKLMINLESQLQAKRYLSLTKDKIERGGIGKLMFDGGSERKRLWALSWLRWSLEAKVQSEVIRMPTWLLWWTMRLFWIARWHEEHIKLQWKPPEPRNLKQTDWRLSFSHRRPPWLNVEKKSWTFEPWLQWTQVERAGDRGFIYMQRQGHQMIFIKVPTKSKTAETSAYNKRTTISHGCV